MPWKQRLKTTRRHASVSKSLETDTAFRSRLTMMAWAFPRRLGTNCSARSSRPRTMAPDWVSLPAVRLPKPMKARLASRAWQAAALDFGFACRRVHNQRTLRMNSAATTKDAKRKPVIYIVDDDD